MELEIKNHLDVNIQNNMPCGSYIIRDGKLVPDMNDEAMKLRHPELVSGSQVKEEKQDEEIEKEI